LPEIAASVAPRKITIAHVLDGGGQPVSVAEARRAYSGSHIEIREETAWDTNALLHF